MADPLANPDRSRAPDLVLVRKTLPAPKRDNDRAITDLAEYVLSLERRVGQLENAVFGEP